MKTEPSAPTPDEPEGGWQSGPDLTDAEILTIALCCYTGVATDPDSKCPSRGDVHADVDCVKLYHQADALREGTVHYDLPAVEVTKAAMGEPTYQHPVLS